MVRTRLTAALVAAVSSCVVLGGQAPSPLTSDALFDLTKIWQFC